MAFGANPIKAKKMNIGLIRIGIRRELLKFAKEIAKEDFEPTYKNFDNDKPQVKQDVSAKQTDTHVRVEVTGDKKAIDKWRWLNVGTKRRWALMSSDWKSKTTPGQLNSSGGSGRPVLVGKRAFQKRGLRPRDGIKARNWTKIIHKKRKKDFKQRIIKGHRETVKKLYG